MRLTIPQAISQLKSGHVIGVPTETVYGLAACLDQPSAIEQIFILKGRPKVNPLIIHIAQWQDVQKYVQHYPSQFEKLAQVFWPGPLTCILPVKSNVPAIVRASLPTAGFRVPLHKMTRELIQATGPLVMPSANLSGRPSSTRPEHVEEDFGVDFPVLDGGVCSKGVESTILLYSKEEWVIVRLGALSGEAFIPVLGYEPRLVQETSEVNPICPGQMFRHYAPRARLLIGNLSFLKEVPYVLGFTERDYPLDKQVIRLGSLDDPQEVAENLYEALRELDRRGASQVWVDMDFPREGLWKTIAERLTRAAK